MKENIDKIWAKFISGDVEAFAIIYNQYVNPLFHYGIKINSDEESVKDAIQEIFLNLYLKRHSNKTNPENLKFYLMLAVKRNLIKKLIKERKLIKKDVADSDFFDTVYSIEYQLIEKEKKKEKNNLVITALKQLTSRQKEAVYLRFTEALEYKEIATLLNITVESARKQVWRALESIRKKIKNEALPVFFMFFNKNPYKN